MASWHLASLSFYAVLKTRPSNPQIRILPVKRGGCLFRPHTSHARRKARMSTADTTTALGLSRRQIY